MFRGKFMILNVVYALILKTPKKLTHMRKKRKQCLMNSSKHCEERSRIMLWRYKLERYPRQVTSARLQESILAQQTAAPKTTTQTPTRRRPRVVDDSDESESDEDETEEVIKKKILDGYKRHGKTPQGKYPWKKIMQYVKNPDFTQYQAKKIIEDAEAAQEVAPTIKSRAAKQQQQHSRTTVSVSDDENAKFREEMSKMAKAMADKNEKLERSIKDVQSENAKLIKELKEGM